MKRTYAAMEKVEMRFGGVSASCSSRLPLAAVKGDLILGFFMVRKPSELDALLCADNVELGTACGKLHRVSTLAITDAGKLLPPLHVQVDWAFIWRHHSIRWQGGRGWVCCILQQRFRKPWVSTFDYKRGIGSSHLDKYQSKLSVLQLLQVTLTS